MFKEFCEEKGTATPYELWHGRKPSLDHLWPWGSAGYVHNLTHKHGKLGPGATNMVFIRYLAHYKGYVIYGEYPNSGMTKIESRNVNFLENEFPSTVSYTHLTLPTNREV